MQSRRLARSAAIPTQFDLLLDPICTIFAINCRVSGSTLEIGALYLEPLIQDSLVTLSHEDVTLKAELPLSLLHSPRAFIAVDYELPLRQQ
jgi:hypothetical protein